MTSPISTSTDRDHDRATGLASSGLLIDYLQERKRDVETIECRFARSRRGLMSVDLTVPDVLTTPEEQPAPEAVVQHRRQSVLRRELAYIVRRVLLVIPMMLVATFLVFVMMQLTPGDTAGAIVGDTATPERLAEIREQLHLDDPLIQQYGRWIGGAVHGDFGDSLFLNRPVRDLILDRLPATISLAIGALVFMAFFGVLTGIAAAVRRSSWIDRVIGATAGAAVTVPSFWLGMVLVVVFALHLEWLPAGGFVSFFDSPIECVRHLALPSIALGLTGAAEVSRHVRSSMIETMDSPFMLALRAKGLSRRSLVFKHALRNAALPVVTVMGLQVNRTLGGAVVLEGIFSVLGLGSLMIVASTSRDYTVVLGVVFVLVLTVLMVNLVVDILYRILDPRIRAA